MPATAHAEPLVPPHAAYDWSSSNLGTPEQWPHTLRLTVDIMLSTPLPMLLDWGDQHISVCNAAYAELAGTRFVRVPGGSVPALRPAPLSAAPDAFARARAGEALTLPRQQVAFLRDDGARTADQDLHLLPVRDEAGQVAGVLCTLVPSTGPVQQSVPDSLRILVVEDNLDSQYLVCEMLRAFGHEPDGSGHAEEAFKLFKSKHYDVLFTDVSLPGMSGVELARLAVEQRPDVHVIFASGYGDTLLKHVGFPYQSLLKPYELDQLQNALGAIVQKGKSGV